VSAFVGLLAILLAACCAVVGIYLLHVLTAIRTDPLLVGPFLSGFRPAEHAVSRFHVRWYAVSLLFLAFDVEMLFMYPWALVVAEVGTEAVVEMFAFLGVLMAGVVYAWREGALRWA
jgi:NADH-quinone oxidoreductase subunit A